MIKRSRRVHLIVEEPESEMFQYYGPDYDLDLPNPWNEPIEEAVVVPEGVFDQLGFWKPPISRSKVTILSANFAQLEQGVVGAIIAKYMEGLAEALVKAAESIQDSAIVIDSYATSIKGEFYEWNFYNPYYKKYRGERHQKCFTFDPIYLNPFTKPHIIDMRLHIFRPRLRCNHPKK